MGIIINLDVVMAQRKIGLTELAGEVDITLANLSILKNNKAKAIRLSTLDAICKALNCQPGDILEYAEDSVRNEFFTRQFVSDGSKLPDNEKGKFINITNKEDPKS